MVHPDYILQNFAFDLEHWSAAWLHSLRGFAAWREVTESGDYQPAPSRPTAVKACARFSRRKAPVEVLDGSHVRQIQMFENLGGAPFASGVAGKFLVGHIANCGRYGGLQFRQFCIHGDLVE